MEILRSRRLLAIVAQMKKRTATQNRQWNTKTKPHRKSSAFSESIRSFTYLCIIRMRGKKTNNNTADLKTYHISKHHHLESSLQLYFKTHLTVCELSKQVSTVLQFNSCEMRPDMKDS